MLVDVTYRDGSKVKMAKRKRKTSPAPAAPIITVAALSKMWGERNGRIIIQGHMGQPIAKADAYRLNTAKKFDSIHRFANMTEAEILAKEVAFFRFEDNALHIYIEKEN